MKRLSGLPHLPAARPDLWLVITLVAIASLGLVMVGSSSVAVAENMSNGSLHYFYRQAIYGLLGLVLGFAVLHVPLRVLLQHTFTMLGIGIALLVLVLIPGVGHSVNGAQRWLDLGPIALQASEPARLCFVLYIAGYATRRQTELATTWGGLLRPMVFLVLACFLMLLEPDFGACAILLAVAAIILFLAGARLLNLVVLAGAGGGLLTVMIVSSPYRMQRLIAFSDPWAHPFASGFQLTQSLIAIGRGHIFGVGLGNSVQKLSYLPETHTDFLFAIYAEEFGLFGSVLLIVLFSVVVWRGFAIAARAIERDLLFGGLLAYGLSAWLVLQAFLNIAVNMGLLPTKGLTLPLMSYGGSSLVIMCTLCAMLLRVDMESSAAAPPESTR